MYDYEKRVKEQANELANLRKMESAYSSDSSEEARAKLQEIKMSISEAEDALAESEYDRYISDQQTMLDSLYENYSELLNTRLDDLSALVSDMILEINADATSISTIIAEKADSVGYTLTDSMRTIWNENSLSTKNVIAMYGDKFSTAQTTTNTALNNINTNLQSIVNKLNATAQTNIKNASTSSTASSKSSSSTSSSGSGSTTNPTGSSSGSSSGSNSNKNNSSDSSKKAASSSSSGSSKGSFFIYKKDSYPKNKLNKETSIIDRLKYHNYDSSFSARAKYYKAMGYKDTYKGSAAQNKTMISWMKKNGYATGVQNLFDKELAWTQEKGQEYIIRPSDGAILTPLAKGDSVLSASASNNIWDMANSPAEFIKDNLNLGTTNMPNNSTNQNNIVQNLENININLPNVKNYEQLLSAMQKDKTFEKLILSMSIDRIAGKSGLAKGKAIR